MSLKRLSIGTCDSPPCRKSERRLTVPRFTSQPTAPFSTSMVEMVCVIVTRSCTGPFCRLMSLQPARPSSATAMMATIFVVFLIPPPSTLRGPHDARRDEDQQLIVRVVDVMRLEQGTENGDLVHERHPRSRVVLGGQ